MENVHQAAQGRGSPASRLPSLAAARLKPLRYAAAVQRGMCAALGADRGYAGLVTKNPLHPRWQTWEIHGHSIELGVLAEYLDLDAANARQYRLSDVDTHGLGRIARCTNKAAHGPTARSEGIGHLMACSAGRRASLSVCVPSTCSSRSRCHFLRCGRRQKVLPGGRGHALRRTVYATSSSAHIRRSGKRREAGRPPTRRRRALPVVMPGACPGSRREPRRG